MEIVIATHQKKTILCTSFFLPIQVNVANSNYILDKAYLLDNFGEDNISAKNESYCELTALYYLWKYSNSNVVGLMHYRRIFNFYQSKYFKPNREKKIKENSTILKKLTSNKTESLIERMLEDCDVILPYYREHKDKSVAQGYRDGHIASDWDICMEIIIDKYPEYKISIEKYMENSGVIYGRNMFVSSKKWLNDYAIWLFDILFELEKRIKISNNSYQKRVFGFMSERLLTLYVRHHNYVVKHLQFLFIE